MIALLNSHSYFCSGEDNVKDFLIAYAEYIGSIDTKVFKILANSGEMTVKELIEYINNHCYSYDEKIQEIYELGKKFY